MCVYTASYSSGCDDPKAIAMEVHHVTYAIKHGSFIDQYQLHNLFK